MRAPRSPILALALLCSCAPAVRATRLSAVPYEPRPADYPIRMYQSERPRCAFEEVGLVTSRQRNQLIPMDQVVEALRAQARQLGGDAVVGVGESDQLQGAALVGRSVIADRDPVVSGTVIRFKDSECTE